jgi:hypothetical protein
MREGGSCGKSRGKGKIIGHEPAFASLRASQPAVKKLSLITHEVTEAPSNAGREQHRQPIALSYLRYAAAPPF